MDEYQSKDEGDMVVSHILMNEQNKSNSYANVGYGGVGDQMRRNKMMWQIYSSHIWEILLLRQFK